MRTILVATNNTHKAEEIASALALPNTRFITLRDAGIQSDPAEDANTFEGNARIKARAAQAAYKQATGETIAVLADDSGLEVDALGGAPGVYSARFAGVDGAQADAANNAKLLEALVDVPQDERTARFVCTLVFIDEAQSETVARGTIEGVIGYNPRGTEGFGYDPLFYPQAYAGKLTLAEVSQEEKNSISHRGNALRELASLFQPC